MGLGRLVPTFDGSPFVRLLIPAPTPTPQHAHSPRSSSHSTPSSPQRRNAGPEAEPGMSSTQSSQRERRGPGPQHQPRPQPRLLRSRHSALGTERDNQRRSGRWICGPSNSPVLSPALPTSGQLTKVFPGGRVVHVMHQLLGQPLQLLFRRLAQRDLRGGNQGFGPTSSSLCCQTS